MEPRAPVYVFGFGSLINSMSRARTLGTGPAWPVRVRGLRRGFYAPSRKIRHTALGVVFDSGSVVNGVLSEIPEGALERLDRREAQYDRVELSLADVEILADAPPRGRVVTYVPKRVAAPDAEHPVIRSYVDVTLSGCLEYGRAFAREMLLGTEHWTAHFEDDRGAPRYPHHEAHAPDDVLDDLVGSLQTLGRASPGGDP